MSSSLLFKAAVRWSALSEKKAHRSVDRRTSASSFEFLSFSFFNLELEFTLF